MIKALSKLDVITLFVEDLPESKAFYTEVFGLEVIYEDDASAVVKMSNLAVDTQETRDTGKGGPLRLAWLRRLLSTPAS
jgi:catechol 2,3-dioxygenase-like lactoylglutathione lyase family enzyme